MRKTLTLALAPILVLIACDRQSIKSSISPFNAQATPSDSLRVKHEYCTEGPPVQVRGSYHHMGHAVAGDRVYLSDIEEDAVGNLYILNPLETISVYSRDGAFVTEITPKALGLSDFSKTTAFALGKDGSIYLSTSDKRLLRYDRNSRRTAEYDLTFRPEDITVTTNGDVYLAAAPSSRDTVGGPVLVRLIANTQTFETLKEYFPSDIGQRPYIAPMNNVAQLSNADENRVILWFLYDRTAFVYEAGRLTEVAQGCMPKSVLESYTRQRSVANPSFSSALVMVAGAWFEGDTVVLASLDGNRNSWRQSKFVQGLATVEVETALDSIARDHFHRRQSRLRDGTILVWTQRGRRHLDNWQIQEATPR